MNNVLFVKNNNWATKWILTFSPAKSESLLISRRRADLRHPELILNNKQTEKNTSHKHLGLVFSTDGTWHKYIKLITSKAWSRINMMPKLKFQFDEKLKILYGTIALRSIKLKAGSIRNNKASHSFFTV